MRLAATCALIGFALVALVVGVQARPAASAEPVLKAELVDFRPWLGPTNDLTATLRLTNSSSAPLPLSGLQIHVDGFAGPGSRSQLADQLQGSTGLPIWSDTAYLSLPALAPGESRDVAFDLQAPLSSIAFFKTKADDRAYPIRFTVGAGGYTAAPIDTQLLYFTEQQSVGHPLGLSLVIPLDAPPAFDPQGREVSQDLEHAISNGGRISRILSALEDPSHADVSVTVAPSGSFLDNLALMAANPGSRVSQAAAQVASATIQRLQSLAARPGIRLIASAYSGALLPALAANGISADVAHELSAGQDAIRTILHVDPLPGWFLPSQGLLDDATFGQLSALGVRDVVVSPSSLQSIAPPLLTPAAPMVLRSQSGSRSATDQEPSMDGLVVDPVLDSRLTGDPGDSPIQVRQQFLAESATILEEQPAHARSIAVLAPADWDPAPVVVSGILDALAPGTGSPWMTGVTPDGVIAQSTDTSVRALAQSVTDALGPAPAKDYLDQLRSARAALDNFAAIGPPATLVDQLTRRLLVAEGGQWWGKGSTSDRGRGYARAVSDAVKGEFAKIRAPKDQLIVLTNRHATIPLALTSLTTYPVTVRVGLESDKLAFLGTVSGVKGEPCNSTAVPAQTTCLTLSLLPGAQTIQVKATANFSGSFHVQVDLLTDNASPARISTGSLAIRSTAYNIVALGIMGGAALFILVSWVRGVGRRRAAGGPPPAPRLPAPAPSPAPEPSVD